MTTIVSTPRFAARIASPFGDLFAVVDEAGALVLLDFVGGKDRALNESDLELRFADEGCALEWSLTRLEPVKGVLERYFSGRAEALDLPVAPNGTEFQKRVWAELVRIPYGQTITYGELARRIGRPAAARAVGRANATNPISLVVPCHRVIGTGGALTGYAGGIERKRGLLVLEGALETEASA